MLLIDDGSMLRRGGRDRRAIRSSSGITPPSPIAGMALWLRADKGWTAGATTTWADQSGNGINYTQSTAAQQPTQTIGAGPLAGTQMGIVFVGSSSQTLTNASQGVLGINNWTAYFVLKAPSAASAQLAYCAGNGGGTGWGFGVGASGANRSLIAIGNAVDTFGAATSGYEKWTIQNNAGTLSARVNGSPVTVTGASLPASIQASSGVGALAGSVDPFTGNIWEILLYNVVHSGGQITTNESYQNFFSGL